MRLILLSFSLIFCCTLSFSQNGGVDPSNNNNKRISNGNATLGKAYDVSKCGLNFAYARATVSGRSSTITTYSGLPCTLAISGIPTICPVIEKAYLWSIVAYGSSGAAEPNPASFTVTNPLGTVFTYPGVIVGTDIEKCWGEISTVTYRVDVTSAINGNGNGSYIINSDSPASSMDGLLLMIIYTDGNVTYNGRLIIYDGCHSTNAGATETQTMSISPAACGASTFGQAFNLVSDCQYPAAIIHKSTLNGASASYTDNFFNFDIATTTVTSGQSTANFGVVPGSAVAVSDCYAWGMMGLYFKNSCVACAGGCSVPLELINFNARSTNKGALITWATATEKETANFELERSSDGLIYIPIARMAAAVNSNTLKTYSYQDAQPAPGTNYYRLKMTDQDGTVNYSSSLTFTGNAPEGKMVNLQLTGVKALNKPFAFLLPDNTKTVEIKVYDITGQLVDKNTYIGEENLQIDFTTLPEGYYFIKAGMGDECYGVAKFVK